MITVPLVKKIAELFLILFATAALVKAGVFRADFGKVLSRVSLNFVTPCVIFNSFQKTLTPEIRQGLLIVKEKTVRRTVSSPHRIRNRYISPSFSTSPIRLVIRKPAFSAFFLCAGTVYTAAGKSAKILCPISERRPSC